jgi:hypothetical protein
MADSSSKRYVSDARDHMIVFEMIVRVRMRIGRARDAPAGRRRGPAVPGSDRGGRTRRADEPRVVEAREHGADVSGLH